MRGVWQQHAGEKGRGQDAILQIEVVEALADVSFGRQS
jgi:hypothetical protein